jgi:hypothetical protein
MTYFDRTWENIQLWLRYEFLRMQKGKMAAMRNVLASGLMAITKA